MLIVEILQALLAMGLLAAAGMRPAYPLLVWTAVGFGTTQILSALDGSLGDSFFRAFACVGAAAIIDRARVKDTLPVPAWTAGPAALLCGLLIGWTS
ncbi:hypothetical protein [Streptomyces sp. NPDC048489]|uniref:hypothetical protein n=1 Tax=Streptomyces sp. NPDC048489 TaxID=3154504 RepID=UPI00341EA9E6